MCEVEKDGCELSVPASCQNGRLSRNSREKCVCQNTDEGIISVQLESKATDVIVTGGIIPSTIGGHWAEDDTLTSPTFEEGK